MFATGTGNILEPVALDLSNYRVLLVKPDIEVSTKEAFDMITPPGNRRYRLKKL